MAEYDDIEIPIEADASEADRALAKLISDFSALDGVMGRLSSNGAFKSLNLDLGEAGKQISEAGKKLDDAFKGSEGAKKAQADIKGVSDRAKDLLAKYADLGKNFKVSPDTSTAQRDLSKYSNALEKAKLKKEELEATGKTGGQMYEYAIKDIAKYTNLVEKLQEKLNSTSNSNSPKDFWNVDNSEITQSTKSIQDFTEQLQKADASLESGGNPEIILSGLQTSLAELQSMFPQDIDLIDSFKAQIELTQEACANLGNAMDNLPKVKLDASEIQKMVDAQEKYKKGISFNIDTSRAEQKLDKVNDKIKNIQPLRTIDSFNNDYEAEKYLDDLNAKIQQTEERMEKMTQLGVSPDSQRFKGMQLDLDRYRATLQEIEPYVRKLQVFNGEAFRIPIEIPPIAQELEQATSKLDVFKEKMKNLKIIVPTDTMKGYQSELDKIKAKYEQVSETIRKNASLQSNYGATISYRRNLAELEALRNKYQELIQKQRELSIAGQSYKLNFSGALSSLKKLGSSFKKVKSPIEVLKSGFEGLQKTNQKLAGSFLRVTKMLKLMIVRMALRNVIQGMKDGFNNLAVYSDDVNKNMSNLVSSLSQLKNSLAAAFKPIFVTIAPALNKFIQLLIQAINYVNQLVSALLGFSSWTKAGYQAKDYAKELQSSTSTISEATSSISNLGNTVAGSISGYEDATSKIADSTKGLNKNIIADTEEMAKKVKKSVAQLQGFDELNNLASQDTSGGSGSSKSGKSFDGAFSDLPIDEAIKKLADKLKNMDMSELGKYIADNISKMLEGIDWNKAYAGAKKFGKGLADFLNGLFNPRLFTNVGKTIASALNTAIYAALSFGTNFDFKGLGKSIADGLNGFFKTLDTKALAQTISTYIRGALQTVTSFLREADFYMIGQKIGEFLANLDLGGILKDFAKALASALGGIFKTVGGMIKTAPFESLAAAFLLLPKAAKSFTLTKMISALTSVTGATRTFVAGIVGAEGTLNKLGDTFTRSAVLGMDFRKAFTQSANIKEFFSTISGGVKSAVSSLSVLTKGVVGAVAVFAEFKVFKDSFKGIVSGTESVTSAIGKMTLATGPALIALGTMFGPAGVIVGGAAAVVGAIVGINQAYNEMIETAQNDALKNALVTPGGIPIEQVAEQYKSAFDEITSGFNAISSSSSNVDTLNQSISGTWTEIEKVQLAMESGVTSVEDGTAQLQNLFATLSDTTQQRFSEMENTLMLAFGEGGAMHEYMEQMGVDTKNLMGTILGVNADAIDRLAEIREEMSKLDPMSEEYQKLAQEAAKISGQIDGVSDAVDKFTKNINSIDIDYSGLILEDGTLDTDALDGYFTQITDAIDSAQDDIDKAGAELEETLQNELQTAINSGASDLEIAEIQNALNELPDAIQMAKDDVARQGQAMADTIQEGLVNKTSDLMDKAAEEWSKLDEKAKKKTDYQTFVAKIVKDYQNALDKSGKNLNTSFEKFGIKGAGWMGDAFGKISSSMKLEYDPTTDTYTLVGNLDKLMSDAIALFNPSAKRKMGTAGQSTGKDYIAGFNEGVDSEKGKTVPMIISFANKNVIEPLKEELEINSPSRLTKRFGMYFVQGFNNGISENAGSAVTTVSKLVSRVTNKIATQTGDFRSAGKSATNSLRDGMLDNEGTLWDKVRQMVSRVADKIKNAFNFKNLFGGNTSSSLEGLDSLTSGIQSKLDSYEFSIKVAPDVQPTSFNSADFKSDNSYNNVASVDNTETNTLLRELIGAVRDGRSITIDGREIGRTVQRVDREFFERTGKGMFDH